MSSVIIDADIVFFPFDLCVVVRMSEGYQYVALASSRNCVSCDLPNGFH
jgi:hypothetical protein